jgi:hypothetical protein
MTRWDAFSDVCGYLRAGILGGKPPQRRRNREWKLLIEMSSFQAQRSCNREWMTYQLRRMVMISGNYSL